MHTDHYFAVETPDLLLAALDRAQDAALWAIAPYTEADRVTQVQALAASVVQDSVLV